MILFTSWPYHESVYRYQRYALIVRSWQSAAATRRAEMRRK